jgi:hypothetical protein
MPGHSSKVTTDHEEIRRWVEARGGWPARVKGTGDDDDPGLIRIDFPGYSGEESLEPISWDEWFRKFDERKLAFVYQDTTATGEKSFFNKLVSRDSVEGEERPAERERAPARSASGATGATGSRAKSSTERPATKSSQETSRSKTQRDGASARGASSRPRGREG